LSEACRATRLHGRWEMSRKKQISVVLKGPKVASSTGWLTFTPYDTLPGPTKSKVKVNENRAANNEEINHTLSLH